MNVPEMAAIARLAGRGARRNWKRTTLIVALIAVPVAASQVAAGMVKSSRIEPEEYVAETLGDGDVRVTANYPTPRSVGWVSDQLASLAPGAEMLRFRNAYGTTPALDESLEVTDLDLEAPLAAGMLHLA